MSKSYLHISALLLPVILGVNRLEGATNLLSNSSLTNWNGIESPLPGAGVSVLRVIGALILVLGLFGLAIWLIRNSQRLGFRLGPQPKLRVLEARSLSYRHSMYVVAYEQQRFLVGTSPGDISLLSELPPAENTAGSPASPPASFADALRHILHGKS